jgi:hypothetical protein
MTIPDDPGGSASQKPQRLVVDFGNEAANVDAPEQPLGASPSDAALRTSPQSPGPFGGPHVAAPTPVIGQPAVVATPPTVAAAPLVASGPTCTTCGRALKVTDQFCTQCGAVAGGSAPAPPPISAAVSCPRCGQAVGPGQAHCHQCGSPVTSQMGVMVRSPKDKSVAILLAVFLSFWSWLYTYELDKQKFWTGLGVAFGSAVLGALLLFPLIIPIGIWIWAIVDVCQKPDTYYRQYPQG